MITKYGKTKCGIFTIEGGNTPTCIHFYPLSYGASIEVSYRYDVPDNTIKNDSFEEISRKEFYKKLREIESNLGGKIYIKKTW
jgi:hypothetical protein